MKRENSVNELLLSFRKTVTHHVSTKPDIYIYIAFLKIQTIKSRFDLWEVCLLVLQTTPKKAKCMPQNNFTTSKKPQRG